MGLACLTLAAPRQHVATSSPPSACRARTNQNGGLPPTLEVPPRARSEQGDLFPLPLGPPSKVRTGQGDLIPSAPGARPPPPASRHAIGRAPPTTKVGPHPRWPDHSLGWETWSHHLPLLLPPPLLPTSLDATSLAVASLAASTTVSSPRRPSSSSAIHPWHGSLPSQPCALAAA